MKVPSDSSQMPQAFWRLALQCSIGSRSALVMVLGAGVLAAVFGVLAPFLQKHFIDSLWLGFSSGMAVRPAEGLVSQSDAKLGEYWSQLTFIVAAFLCTLFAQLCSWFIRIRSAAISVAVQKKLAQSVYEQSLYLHPHTRGEFSVGELVTYYAQDVSASGSLSEECLPNLLASFLPLVVAPIAIGMLVGTNLLLVFGVAAFGITICFGMAWRQAALFTAYKDIAQDRLGVVNEWLQNLKLLRVSGRIAEFEAKIREVRIRETQSRMDMVTNASLMNGFSQLLPQLINLAGLSALVVARPQGIAAVTPGEIFGFIWVLGIFLGMPIRQLPWALVNAVDGLSSLRRIHDFIGKPVTRSSYKRTDKIEAPVEVEKRQSSQRNPGVAIKVQQLNVVSPGGVSLLALDEFDAAPGELIAVVGAVGAGKSLFFSALTGDIPAHFGSYRIDGQDYSEADPERLRVIFAVVPQQGFVMNADLRRNVGLDYGAQLPADERLRMGLNLADFDPTTERMTADLDTSLGERGVNLSGGQRQRLSLARATQFDRPIVLLDDSLSAVDVVTERNLVRDLIQGYWCNKTRLVITHRLSILPMVSRVLFLQEGRVGGFDRYDELMKQNEAFRRFALADGIDESDEFDEHESLLANDGASGRALVPPGMSALSDPEGLS
jgi:ATP-binding cassette subfamily B multidrug efflux pump